MAEYLTNTADLTEVADAIRVKGGTSEPLVYPSGFVSAIQSIDTTGGTKPATLTITSSDYTGKQQGVFVFVNSEGHIERLDRSYGSGFTFPITIETVIGGFVLFQAERIPGIPSTHNPVGCENNGYQSELYILVTSPQASIEVYDFDK